MKARWNSALTLAFEVEHSGEWPTADEALAALLKRVAELLTDPIELEEAILGDRFDVHEVEEEAG